MRVWDLPGWQPARAAGGDAVAELIGCIGDADFGQAALTSLNRAVAAASWSVYRIHPDDPPALCASATLGIPDTTHACFSAYRAGLYRRDRSFAEARRQTGDGAPVLTHCRADDIQVAQREQIYRRFGMRERLSIVSVETGGSLLAVNLYRHAHQPDFGDADIDALQAIGPGLLACVKRHLGLAGVSVAAVGAEPLDALRRHCPALTDRELQVCGRLLLGWTHDGIAADLGLAVTTVKTYRNRAFERLGIHFRNQLFDCVRRTNAEPTH